MSYFLKIKEPMHRFFINEDFYPKNVFDADAYVRGFLKFDKQNVLDIKLDKPVKMNGKTISSLRLSKDDYIDVCCPLIWEQLSARQKMHALVFAFDDIVNKDYGLKKEKPQLVFDFATNLTGELKINNKKPVVFLSGDFIVMQKTNSIDALATIVHELYHYKQEIFAQQTKERIKSNQKKKISNKNIADYHKNIAADSYGNIFNHCTDFAKENNIIEHYTKSRWLNYPDLEDVMYFDKIKDSEDWNKLLDLFYFVETFEKGAFNKELNYTKSIDKYFEKTFDDYDAEYSHLTKDMFAINCIKELNNNFGYNLKEEDIDEFVKINQLLINTPFTFEFIEENNEQKKIYQNDYQIPESHNFYNSITWWCLKKMLAIHKNKCVTEKIEQQFVDESKEKYNKIIDEYELFEE